MKDSFLSTASTTARFMESLRAKDPHALGFIPISAYDQAINRGRVLLESHRGELCGFLLWARRKTTLRVHQIVVADDVRRVTHATNLLARLIQYPGNESASSVILRCADDLEANAFWTSLGFQKIEVVVGGKSRKPRINLQASPLYFSIHRALGMRTLRDIIGPTAQRRMINVYRLARIHSVDCPCILSRGGVPLM